MKLFYNAKFYSMVAEGEFFKAMLVKNGKIIETYDYKPVFEHIEEIDLKGTFVLPGISDTHTHSFEGGLYSLSVNLEQVKNLDEVFQLLSEATPIAGKIFAFHFDENQISEKRFPTKEELDKIWPEVPLLLRRVDGHSCVINSKAADMIDWENPLPGDFNGHLYKRINGKASNWFHRNLDDESILNAYQAASEIAINNGITSVHTMIGDAFSDPKHYNLIANNLNMFSTRFILYPQISEVDLALELGSKRIGGCILADGSIGSYTAALKEPYSDNPGTRGELYRTDEFWLNFVKKAHNSDLQVCIHCIGDRAIDQILRCYEKVELENPKNLKHQFIHNELTSDTMLDRMAKANVAAVMQPMFDYLWAGENGLYEKRLGVERTRRTTRLRSIYDREILLTGGSDWYITDLNSLKGINAATKIHNIEERLTPFEAVNIYTKNAAQLAGDEKIYGQLIKGLDADFVCLEQDLFSSDDIANINIKAVYKDGVKLK